MAYSILHNHEWTYTFMCGPCSITNYATWEFFRERGGTQDIQYSSISEGGGAAETARHGKRVKRGAKCWKECAKSLLKLFLTPVNLYQLQTHTSHNRKVWHSQITTHEHIIILSHTSFMSTTGESSNRNVWSTKVFRSVEKEYPPLNRWRGRYAHEVVFVYTCVQF